MGLAGSKGYSGAAILSSWAALKSGAGIVRLLHDEKITEELLGSPYELIKTAYNPENIDSILNYLNTASAVFIGPGLVRTDEVRELLKKILPRITKPCVLDADALFHLSKESILLPQQCILTPHTGVMARLLGIDEAPPISYEYLQKCLRYAIDLNVTLVLKGGPTFVMQPGELIHVCAKGDPGMATAGAGDVLTGVITGLLAQGISTYDAACLGTFIHGLAGEHAADDNTPYCMTASDIVLHLPDGFILDEL